MFQEGCILFSKLTSIAMSFFQGSAAKLTPSFFGGESIQKKAKNDSPNEDPIIASNSPSLIQSNVVQNLEVVNSSRLYYDYPASEESQYSDMDINEDHDHDVESLDSVTNNPRSHTFESNTHEEFTHNSFSMLGGKI